MAELLEETKNRDVVGSKRQRRPSVRLGDLGGGDLLSSYYYHPLLPRQQRRSSKQQQQQPRDSKVSKDKPTLSDAPIDFNNNNNNNNIRTTSNKGKKGLKKRICYDEETEGDLDGVVIGSWKTRVSASKAGRGNMDNLAIELVNGKKNDDEIGDVGNRDFEPICSDEEKEGSPVHLFDQDNSDSDDFDGHGNGDVNGQGDENGVEEGVNGKDLRFQVSDEMEDPSELKESNGVKVWLKKIGLERYAPVFEIHEVDDEVLPLLTLEDLKDMGITAVGSRRKMFCSIKNLNK